MYRVVCIDGAYDCTTEFTIKGGLERSVAKSIARKLNKICPDCQSYYVEEEEVLEGES